jgi:hypothetical protein
MLTPPTTAQVLAHLRGYPADVSWGDYKPVATSPDGVSNAYTEARFNVSYDLKVIIDSGNYRVSNVLVTVTKIKGNMWAVSGAAARTAALLKHEQGHFDIVGLCARDLCRELLATGYDVKEIAKNSDAGSTQVERNDYVWGLAQPIIEEAVDRANALSASLGGDDGKYDTETDHSNNATGQTKWNDLLRRSRLNDIVLATLV